MKNHSNVWKCSALCRIDQVWSFVKIQDDRIEHGLRRMKNYLLAFILIAFDWYDRLSAQLIHAFNHWLSISIFALQRAAYNVSTKENDQIWELILRSNHNIRNNVIDHLLSVAFLKIFRITAAVSINWSFCIELIVALSVGSCTTVAPNTFALFAQCWTIAAKAITFAWKKYKRNAKRVVVINLKKKKGIRKA